MKLLKMKATFLVALTFSLLFLAGWELYWRSKSDLYVARVDDDRYLWAQHRAKVESATKDDVVILGASRTGFNFRTQAWKEVQGIEPINLSTDGKPPGPFFIDIVENTAFNGTFVIGVTPLMFFDSTSPMWAEAKHWIEHYHKQTYAQKLNYFVSKPLQRNLVMLNSSELNFYNDLDLKSLINTIPLKGRIGSFILPNFSYNDESRNLIMLSKMTEDPAFAKRVTNAWESFLPYVPDYEVIADGFPPFFDLINNSVKKFKARGGKIIFIRHKAEPQWNQHTKRIMPREKVWDKFIKLVNCPAYHFEDYEFMQKHTLPDWSHMSAESAPIYTRDMVTQMIEEGHLVDYK